MDVLAPMPRAIVTTATIVNDGLRVNVRTANRTSWMNVLMYDLPCPKNSGVPSVAPTPAANRSSAPSSSACMSERIHKPATATAPVSFACARSSANVSSMSRPNRARNVGG